jgi:hypothetical protein
MNHLIKPLLGVQFNRSHHLFPLYGGGSSISQFSGGLILPLNEDSGTPRAYIGPTPGNVPNTGGTERLAVFTGPPKWNPYPGAAAGRSQWAGPTLSHLNTTDVTNFGINTDFIPLDAVTFVVGVRKRDTTLRNAGVFAVDVSTGSRRAELAFLSAGTVYFLFGGATPGTSLLQGPTVTHGDDVWVCSVGNRGMDLWQNGTLLASQTGHVSRTGNTNEFKLGNAPSATGGGDLLDYAFLYIYPRQLDYESIRQISVDPFCFYDTPDDLLVTAPVVGAGSAGGFFSALAGY